MQLEPKQPTQTETPSAAKAADAVPETVKEDAVSSPAVSAEPKAADAAKNAAAESPAPSAEPTPAVRRIIMAPRARMTAPAPAVQSADDLPTPEASESPAPSETPTPSEAPTPSASPAPVKTQSIRIAKAENRDKLLVLLSGTEAAMPDKTPDRIYEAVLVSTDAYGSEEKLSIRIFGTEVWYLSTISGESTSFAAKCSPKELETLLAAVTLDEAAPASPDPSESPVPSVTPDPYLETPEPEAPEQK